MNFSYPGYRLRAAVHHLGRVGGLGLAFLFGAAVFYFSALRPAQEDFAAIERRLERAERLAPDRRGSATSSPMEQFIGFFPPLDSAPRWLRSVYSIAEREKLELLQGTYRVSEDPALMIVRYRVSLPVRGSYLQIRRFIGGTLDEVPIASLEGVVFQREKVSDGAIEASVTFTLHLRGSPRAVRPGQPAQVARSDAPAWRDE